MGTTSHTQAYGESSYWDNRYAGDSKPFDWYQKYSSLSSLVHLYVSPPGRRRVLIVGCGNSLFSEQMADDGYEDVVNVDVSSVVIHEMKMKYADRPPLRLSFSWFPSCHLILFRILPRMHMIGSGECPSAASEISGLEVQSQTVDLKRASNALQDWLHRYRDARPWSNPQWMHP